MGYVAPGMGFTAWDLALSLQDVPSGEAVGGAQGSLGCLGQGFGNRSPWPGGPGKSAFRVLLNKERLVKKRRLRARSLGKPWNHPQSQDHRDVVSSPLHKELG